MASPIEVAWGRPVPLSAAHHAEWRKLVVRDHRLSMGARVVAGVIAENVHFARGKGAIPRLKSFAWKGEEEIGEEIGLGERQVRRCIRDELEPMGYIHVTPRLVGLANGLRLTWPPLPFDRSGMSGKRKRATRPQDPSTGHFCPVRPDILGAATGQNCPATTLKDSVEDFSDRARPAGVSDAAWGQYVGALASGTPDQRRAALRRVISEQGADDGR